MKLILVRHGETEWNVAGRYQGHSDVPLNGRGFGQAQRVAEALANERVERLVSSDLGRARDTAVAIGAVCRVPITIDAGWREMNFGGWEGLTYAEIMKDDGEGFQRWVGNLTAVAPPGGETLAAMSQRIKLAWQKIERCAAETVVLVAHGGSLRLLLCYLLGLPPEAYWQLKLDYAALSYVQVYAAGAMLVSLNDGHHLQNGMKG